MRFGVWLVPRAARAAVDGVTDGRLRIRVTAAPVDGAANAALVRLLAAELELPRGAVRVVAGERSRSKLVEVEGVDPAAIRARWPGLAV